MDNPWATDWDRTWSPQPATQPPPVWLQGDASWDPSPTEDTTAHDHHGISMQELGDSVTDNQSAPSTSPPRDSPGPLPETADASLGSVTSVSDEENLETTLHPPEDWDAAWGRTPSSGETQPPDQWEVARQEKEKLTHAVPPELLDSLLRYCQQVSQEIWPASENNGQDNRRSGLDDHPDIAALLARLFPTDSTLPPTVQFSATATARAMNEALKLTRHVPAAASSPLSRLLASKGSLEWEKSIKAEKDVVPDTAHVGWRVLEKQDRLNTTEDKPRKATGGLLSFWNRRSSAIQAAPVETPNERSTSPARSSLESFKSAPHPSRAASPSKAFSPSVPPPPPTDSMKVATAPAPSAVSRFLNRFSRTKGPHHTSLALSADDLEFLSDVVPSASDPPDEDIDNTPLSMLTGASNSSPPPKLPPLIPPPPRQLTSSSRSPSALGFEALNGMSVTGGALTAFQTQTASHAPKVAVLVPPLSPKPAVSFSLTKSPPLSPKDAATPAVASGPSSTSLIQQRTQPGSQPNPQLHSPFTVPPPQKTPPLLSVPLLPPPPVSPPQTPRQSAFPPATPGHSSTMNFSSFHDSYDSDDEFSAFSSFPPSAPAPFPSPEPPSPPPRHTYERTHYPNSSSTSSILSPASQTSLEQLCTTGSSISASLDSFDDFVPPPPVERGENRKTTSPPPLPVKPQFQRLQPSRVDTFSSRVYHTHTSSQKLASPTVHTSFLNSAFSVTSVSDAEHRRTQGLVDRAAASGGMWPHSPDLDEPRARSIPPPPSSAPSKQLNGEESFDLLGDGETLGGGLEALPVPLNVSIGTGSTVSLATDALGMPFGVAGGPGKGLGLEHQLQLSRPPLPSTPAPILPLSSLGAPIPLAATNPGALQPTKPKQTGGLSAQDLSFFEGL